MDIDKIKVGSVVLVDGVIDDKVFNNEFGEVVCVDYDRFEFCDILVYFPDKLGLHNVALEYNSKYGADKSWWIKPHNIVEVYNQYNYPSIEDLQLIFELDAAIA